MTSVLDQIEAALADVRTEHRCRDVVGVADAAHREVLRLNVARLYGWPATATTYEHVEQWLRSRYCTIIWHRTRASGTLVDLVAADSMPCPASVALALFPGAD
ncbi:hypothetical protein ABZT26_25550 [Streptomyces sp. NPDC005395]|uniref:hypothetical protein n=1 Tax=Streptomyces sp. NPDC005395 TaxID=3157042 RepID=UPI0033B9F62C